MGPGKRLSGSPTDKEIRKKAQCNLSCMTGVDIQTKKPPFGGFIVQTALDVK